MDYKAKEALENMKGISARDLRRAFNTLEREDDGCFYWWLYRGSDFEYALVMGAQKVTEEEDVYVTCIKLAKQSRLCCMQCDYDWDWQQPYSSKTGEVFETEREVSKDEDFDKLREEFINYIEPFFEAEERFLSEEE